MKMVITKIVLLISFSVLFSACSKDEFADVRAFMKEADQQSANIRVDEPPDFEAYRPYSYTGANRRSPFKKPVSIEDALRENASSDVVPNEDRAKEFLEQFDINSLVYVGILEQGQSTWALVRDPDGKVHRLKTGSFLGKDHGRIESIAEEQLIVLEIVPNGLSRWIERPHNMSLKGIITP